VSRTPARPRDRRLSTALVAMGLLLVFLLLVGCGKDPPSPRPNVVVVLLDTVRADALTDGPHRAETPFLDKLRAGSVAFINTRSTSSWTAPATASLFTSLYPNEHGVIQGFVAHRKTMEIMKNRGDAALELNALPGNIATLPERMKADGYRTFGIAANINLGPEIGFSRGFDKFTRLDDATADIMVDSVAAWDPARTTGDEPYFLYVHLNDAHSPYIAHQPWYRSARDDSVADARSRYLSEISFIDGQLSRLADLLDLSRRGLLVIVSDHGEEFFEHGRMGHLPSLHAELNDVVFLVHGPRVGVLPATRPEPVSLIDVMPTVLDLVHLPHAEPSSGLSLAALCRGDDGASALVRKLNERTLFAHRLENMLHGRSLWSAMRGPWKLIQDEQNRSFFYDRERDSREQLPESRTEDPVGAGLEPALAEFRSRPLLGRGNEIRIPLDKKLSKQLKSLGYVR